MSGLILAAFVSTAVEEPTASPNNAAWVAGFALIVLWVAIAAVQVFRQRRRRLAEGAGKEAPLRSHQGAQASAEPPDTGGALDDDDGASP